MLEVSSLGYHLHHCSIAMSITCCLISTYTVTTHHVVASVFQIMYWLALVLRYDNIWVYVTRVGHRNFVSLCKNKLLIKT